MVRKAHQEGKVNAVFKELLDPQVPQANQLKEAIKVHQEYPENRVHLETQEIEVLLDHKDCKVSLVLKV